MALITSIPAITTQQIAALSETLFEGFFNDPALTSLVNVQSGIISDKQLVIFERHTGLAGAKVVACPTPTNAAWGFGTIEKVWAPKQIGDRFAECWTTFHETCLRALTNLGVDKADLTGTEIAAFIAEQLQDMINEVYMRHFWFGDKGMVSGTANNVAAGDVKYFNVIDGIFAQAFDIVTADALRLTAGLGTKNGQASYALQKFDATDVTNKVVSTTMDNMWYDADIRMRGMAKNSLSYFVTQSVADQLERERKSISGINMPYERQENGMDTLTWNGIKVVPIQLWDRMIAEHLGDDLTPVKSTLPHRIILAPSSNIVLGVESEGSLGELKVWHSEDDEMMYARFLCGIDAKIGLDKQIQLAY